MISREAAKYYRRKLRAALADVSDIYYELQLLGDDDRIVDDSELWLTEYRLGQVAEDDDA